MDIKLENVFYKYTGCEDYALADISCTFKGGALTALTGRSGSGKSTLLRLMSGFLFPTDGTILIDGEDVTKKRKNISILFQNSEDQLFEKSVIDDVAFGLLNSGVNKNEAFARAEKALSRVGIKSDKWPISPFRLSGGEKRRVALAGLLVLERDILLLDEISSSLDRESRDEIFSILLSLKDEGKTIVFTSHSVPEMSEWADSIVLLSKGEVKAEGGIDAVYSYDDEYLTQGEELRRLLKERGIETGNMDTFNLALENLSSLLHTG